MRVCPRPMIAAPSSWPRTWAGLSALPTSDTVTWRATTMSPVSRSTSTSTAVQLNSKNAAVPPSGWSGSASLRISPIPMISPPSRPSPRTRTSRIGRTRSPIRTSPRRRRSPSSSTHSSRAAIARSLAWTSRQPFRTAVPMSTDDRLADVCWSYGTTAVSPMTTVTQSIGDAELLGRDLGEDRAGALAHVGGARRSTTTLPSARSRTVEYDSPVVGPGLQSDGQAATATGRRRAPPADQLGGPPNGHCPVAIGRRIAGDEGLAGLGQVAQPKLEGVDAERPSRLVHVRFDGPDLLRIAEAPERRRRRRYATGRSARRSASPGPDTARSTCSSPLVTVRSAMSA